MTDEGLEDAIAEFLERRSEQPSLTPEEFARGRSDTSASLVTAIRTALEVERMFPNDDGLPRVIGGYQVLEEIGRGGMGIVYRVEREGRAFALKLLPLAPILGARMLERFRREVEALSRLAHPHIVRVHDSGMHDEMPYLVMDLVEGKPLTDVAPSLSISEAARIVETLARAVESAHAHGILHRDLKPQNVVVRPDGAPVLLDFGLSVADEFPTFTATSEMLGTPRYMAPEQALGERADARTDVHALGLILYELLLGRPARDQPSREAVLESVRSGRVPSFREAGTLPRDLVKVLLTALARRPARRYASAGALADDLARWSRGEAVAAHPPHAIVRALDDAFAPGQRHRSIAYAALALACLTVGALAMNQASQTTPAERERASRLLDRAIGMWVDHDTVAARAMLADARRLDPRDPTVRVLGAHLARRRVSITGTPCARAALNGLRAYESGGFAEAIAGFRLCPAGELRPALVSAVLGLSAARSKNFDTAMDELTASARLLPASVEIQRELARVSMQLNRLDDGLHALQRAAELAPRSVDVLLERAELDLRRRDLEGGLRTVARAESLSTTENPRVLRIKGILEVHTGRGVEGRRDLKRALEIDPSNVEAAYGIGYSLDLEHDLVGAERSYAHALELKSDHVQALVCLANLHTGASRGQCRGCDAAFAAHPEYLDLGKAERYLLRCLDADRGKTEWVTQSLRDVALRLQRRGAVIQMLERLTAVDDGSPAVLRLKDTLRRVRLVES